MEHPQLIAEWLLRFAKLVGRENVMAGADCGFSSQAVYRTEVHGHLGEVQSYVKALTSRPRPCGTDNAAVQSRNAYPVTIINDQKDGTTAAMSAQSMLLGVGSLERRADIFR